MNYPTIALVMIVKNEAAIIRRCLASVKPFISSWTISDTGSTDKTTEIIECELAGIPGRLHSDEWVSFGHNRTLNIQRARNTADYYLLLDADMELRLNPSAAAAPSCASEAVRSKLDADAYLLRFEGELDYSLPLLVSARHDWSYRGVTHEYLWSSTAASAVRLPGVTVCHHEDGGCRGEKYERDIALLSKALEQEPENPRYAFYFAQSLRNVGRFAEAIDWYEKRVLLGGWNEETWYSLYQIARCQHAVQEDWRVVFNSYLQAFNVRPSRLEPIYHIARFYCQRRFHRQRAAEG